MAQHPQHTRTHALPSPLQHTLSAREKAVVDALAGTIGSLVALWAFYPIDVFKTRVQSTTSEPVLDETENSSYLALNERWDRLRNNLGINMTEWPKSVYVSSSRFLDQIKAIEWNQFFAGLPIKTLHTCSSSFCYFYLYSWIVSWYIQSGLQHRRRGVDAGASPSDKKLETSKRLLLSALAAMLNTFLTLPLDVLASRLQSDAIKENILSTQESNSLTEACQSDDSDEELNPAYGSKKTRNKLTAEQQKQANHIFSKRRMSSIIDFTLSEYGDTSSASFLKSVASLWKGLYPSLLLCSNPAINYTIYDTLKYSFLGQSSSKQQQLTMIQAFFLGILSKFTATIATYPLIRAKVMLMVTHRTSMLGCLIEEYHAHGARGIYKGMHLQLLHTLLKSALLMVVKERIEQTTMDMVRQNRSALGRPKLR